MKTIPKTGSKTPDTKIDFFSHESYRKIMHFEIRRRAGSQWGSISRLAEAVGCQRSHLSRVLNAQKDLTAEQGLSLALYWNLGEAETEYFLTLIDLERAGTPALRKRLSEKIQGLKKDHEDLSRRLKQPPLEDQALPSIYYSAWYWSAIHVLTSIPAYQTSEAIASRLLLPKSLTELTLKGLAGFNLVKADKKTWRYGTGSIHLSKFSPYISQHHQNWRNRAVFDSHQLQTDGVHYSVVQSVSRADYERIKALILEMIDKYSEVALPSACEELVNFNCDFYKV